MKKSRFVGSEYPFGKCSAERIINWEREVNQLIEKVTKTGNIKLLEIYPLWYDTDG